MIHEFEYDSYFLDLPIKVEFEYSMFKGPIYDSPRGPLGECYNTDSSVKRICTTNGFRDFKGMYLKNTDFQKEVESEIYSQLERLAHKCAY